MVPNKSSQDGCLLSLIEQVIEITDQEEPANARLLKLIEQALEIMDRHDPAVESPFPSVITVQQPIIKPEEAPRRRNTANNQHDSSESSLKRSSQ
jgi:hypothetical protein